MRPGQRAIIAFHALPLLEAEAKERQRLAGEQFGENHPKQELEEILPQALEERAPQTRDQAAALVGVSGDGWPSGWPFFFALARYGITFSLAKAGLLYYNNSYTITKKGGGKLTAAMSNAERQKKFREKVAESNLVRLQVLIEPHLADDLKRICEANGWTQRQAVERAIVELAEKEL